MNSSSVDAISGGIAAAVLALTSSQVAARSSQFVQGHAADLQALAFQAREWHQDMQLVAIYLDAVSGCNVPPDLRSRPLAWRTHLATRAGALVSGPAVLGAGTIGPLAAAVGSVGPQAAKVVGFYETAYSFIREIRQEEISTKKVAISIVCGSLRGGCLGLSVGGIVSPDGKAAGGIAGAAVGSVVGALGAAVGSVSGRALKRAWERLQDVKIGILRP